MVENIYEGLKHFAKIDNEQSVHYCGTHTHTHVHLESIDLNSVCKLWFMSWWASISVGAIVGASLFQ